jgi:hypothetical protein
LGAVSELKKKVEGFEVKFDKARDNQKKCKILSGQWQEDEPFVATQESKIIKGDHVAWLWREMGDFAEKEKMNRVAVVPESGGSGVLPSNESFESAGASLTMYCGYHKLGQFVQNLENTFATLQVQQIEVLGGGSATPDTHTVRLQFQLLACREEKQKEDAKGPNRSQPQEKKG